MSTIDSKLTKKTGKRIPEKLVSNQDMRQKLNRCLERRGEVVPLSTNYVTARARRKQAMIENWPEDVFESLGEGDR